MQQVQVQLAERSYSVWIGTNSLNQMIETWVGQLPGWSHAVVIADENVVGLVAEKVRVQLEHHKKRVTLLTVKSGEESKSIVNLASLWEQMLACRTDRKSVVIAVGGGVVGDLAGYAAASYMRGLRFVQVPTTLLAMVDSSVGGKTGINLPAAKNMIGAFWQPHAVWIDTQSLVSLPDREYRSGLAEVVKYGVILDDVFFDYLDANAQTILQRTPDHVQHLVRRSCELKAQVVSQDERETTGLRAILNYGHTFGHAIEAKTAYGRYLHGEAISIGMTMAGRLAVRLGLWNDDGLNRQTALLKRFGLPVDFRGIEGNDLIEAMQMDKKTEHGKLNFILPTRIGHVQSVSGVSIPDVRTSIE
ncbi:MAG: 3-dehydroquinate synthase [Pirellula sp.]